MKKFAAVAVVCIICIQVVSASSLMKGGSAAVNHRIATIDASIDAATK